MSIYNKPLPRPGEHLRRQHLHSFIIVLWILCLVAYLVVMEKAIEAHAYLPQGPGDQDPRVFMFGKRGRKARQDTVQALNIIRTVLTVAHVPILTATLATTLPALTQRMRGRDPPSLTVEQLFLLADKTWAGAGGWYEALLVGNLSWQWWRYAGIVLISFVGFPIVTAGYLTSSEQYWGMVNIHRPREIALSEPLTGILERTTAEVTEWLLQAEHNGGHWDSIGLPKIEAAHGGVFSFYPPVERVLDGRGFFVTFLEPVPEDYDARSAPLIVADTMGLLHGVSCETVEKAEMTDMFHGLPHCDLIPDCPPGMCQEQLTRRDNYEILTCTKPARSTLDAVFKSDLFASRSVGMDVEIAVRMDGANSATAVTRCAHTLVPGNGIVDSIIRRYMHFVPYGLGLTRESSEVLAGIESTLPSVLSATMIPAITLLHEYPDKFLYGNGAYLKDAFPAVANSSFITALPDFFSTELGEGFAYKTDVKIVRGFVPPGFAPFALLMPVLLVAIFVWRTWNMASWTLFLDSFAMFRLGRSFEKEMEGFGATELKDCFIAKRIPGWVGDAGRGAYDGSMSRDYVGLIKLGGVKDLLPGTRYA